MARIINISDKFKTEKPEIQIGEKTYEVNNSANAVIEFEELATSSTPECIVKAMELAIGKENVKELNVMNIPFPALKVLFIAVFAAMQDIDYEEAEARFQQSEPTK